MAEFALIAMKERTHEHHGTQSVLQKAQAGTAPRKEPMALAAYVLNPANALSQEGGTFSCLAFSHHYFWHHIL